MAVLTAIRPRRAPGMVRLVRDGEPWLSVSVDLVVRLGLRSGETLDDDRVAAVEGAAADEDAWRRVVRLVAIRPRTERDLTRALRARGVGRDRAAAAVSRARERGLIDHEGVARMVARRAVTRGEARAHVALRLRAAGVGAEAATAALDEHAPEADPAAVARAWVERRFGPSEALDAAGHARALRMLAARGHTRRTVEEVLGPPPAVDGVDGDAR